MKCISGSSPVFDGSVLQKICEPSSFYSLEFDNDFLSIIPEIAGRKPVEARFRLANGEVHEIGWFVGIADQNTQLPPPHIESYIPSGGIDSRIFDRALPSILSTELNIFDHGSRIIPFAALVTKNVDPGTLVWENFDWPIPDCLCFDRATSPHSVVLVRSELAALETIKEGFESGEAELDYASFSIPVATNFREFCGMLSE